MLQCHPHPGDFADKSKPFHRSYFMGLQRKEGVPANEGGQFDIRITVEEFKYSVNMYTLWKEGMTIRVTHVKRRSLPDFVFPGGIRPSRPTRGTWERKRTSELQASVQGSSDAAGDIRKRKRLDDGSDTCSGNSKAFAAMPPSGSDVQGSPSVSIMSSPSLNMRADHINAVGLGESSKENADDNYVNGLGNSSLSEIPSQNDDIDRPVKCNPPTIALSADTPNSKEAEKVAIEKMMSGPYGAHQASQRELDEIDDDFELGNQVKEFAGKTQDSPRESYSENTAILGAVTSLSNASTSPLLPNTSLLEELEVFSANFLKFIFILPFLFDLGLLRVYFQFLVCLH